MVAVNRVFGVLLPGQTSNADDFCVGRIEALDIAGKPTTLIRIDRKRLCIGVEGLVWRVFAELGQKFKGRGIIARVDFRERFTIEVVVGAFSGLVGQPIVVQILDQRGLTSVNEFGAKLHRCVAGSFGEDAAAKAFRASISKT